MRIFCVKIGVTGFALFFCLLSVCEAYYTPHPEHIYSQGVKTINSYHGQGSALDDAEGKFLKLINDFPDSALGYLGLSKITIIRAYLYGDHYNMQLVYDRAFPLALKAIELNPTSIEAHRNLNFLEEVVKSYESNKQLANDYLTLFPDISQTYFIVANLLRDQNKITKAIEFYKLALELEPNQSLKLKILKRLGNLYLYSIKDFENAISTYRQALEISQEPNLFEFLGLAYFEHKKYEAALNVFKQLLPRDYSNFAQIYLLRSKALLAKNEGHTKDAISILRQTLAYRSDDCDIHFELGSLYFSSDNFVNAYTHFRRVIDLNPNEPRAYFYAGQSAFKIGDRQAAMDFYSQFMKMANDSKEATWIKDNFPELSHK